MNIMGTQTSDQQEDSVRIFTFGDIGAGKSTLLACLVQFFLKNKNWLFVYDHDGKDSKELMMIWLQRLEELKFPPISKAGEIVRIKLGLVNDKKMFKRQIVLYEMSGEDLKKIAARHGGDFEDDFQNALDDSDVILVLASKTQLASNQMLLGEFLNFLYNRNVQKPVAIVVTKWDLENSENSKSSRQNSALLQNLLLNNLSWPIKFLQTKGIFQNPSVFYFTVGSVAKDVITQLHPVGIEEIAQWIVQNSNANPKY